MPDSNIKDMESKIKNLSALVSKGDVNARKIALEVAEEILRELDSRSVIGKTVALNGNILNVGEKAWDLSKKKNVYVVGAGKACNAMVGALHDILGDRVTKGIAIVKIIEPEDNYPGIDIYEGGHPIPNEVGYEASRRIIDLVDSAGPDDLFISAISGGSSALMSCPVDGISLEDEKAVSRLMLDAGARIMEINAVRRHISKLNGGRLAQRIVEKGAELINLILWDVVGDNFTSNLQMPSRFYGTPVGADNTTVDDAINAIEKYGLSEKLPATVTGYLNSGAKGVETPKELSEKVTNFVLQVPADACATAQAVCKKKGFCSHIITTSLEGESSEAGVFLATIAKEIEEHNRPVEAPCFLIVGGESTVSVSENSGRGGPNQEVALSFAQEIEGHKGICLVAVGTDGTDGPTNFAGGIADALIAERAKETGLDLYSYINRHDVYEALKQLDSGIVTGNTGTNLCDLILIYIPQLKN